MNWIINYVCLMINLFFFCCEVLENLWIKCDSCGMMLFYCELSDNLNVCLNCGYYMVIMLCECFSVLFDDGKFIEVVVLKLIEDLLKFCDQKKYIDCMKGV